MTYNIFVRSGTAPSAISVYLRANGSQEIWFLLTPQPLHYLINKDPEPPEPGFKALIVGLSSLIYL